MTDATARPVLTYDGDSSFCRTWIEFWQTLTGKSIEYSPSQGAALELVTPEGRYTGAEAVCRALADAPGYGWMFWCYRFVPGSAAIASLLYAFIAGHRDFAARVTRLFWGERIGSTWNVAAETFSRALAVIYAIAFISFGLQTRGLIGSEGMLPAREFLRAVEQQLGGMAWWRLPTLFWWGSSDVTLLSITWGGVALAFISLITKAHSGWQRAIFALLWVYYLSIVNAGQVFMSFQWDWLLVEAGFLAIFLRPERSRLWLYRWLLFRLMLESGAVKLISGDPTWHGLSALKFHYETQPLPAPLAWYMAQLPAWFQSMSAGVVFAVELVTPFLMLGPRRVRQFAGIVTIVFQVLIFLTGNYTFFNVLTIALCLFLFDDRCFSRWGERSRFGRLNAPPGPVRESFTFITAVVWVMVVFLSVVEIWGTLGKVPPSMRQTAAQVQQFGIVNHYGLFAVMTTERMEIQVEGSQDGQTWEPYLFRYKPGPLNRPLPWVEPLQPRLDWQMWFAALSPPRENPWFVRMMAGLLHGSRSIEDLFEQRPLAGQTPKYVRATIYQYRFTNWGERQKTGNYWKRELRGLYFPVVSLKGQ